MIDTMINNLLVFLAVLGGILAYGIVFAAVKRSMTKKVNSPAPCPENPTVDFLETLECIDQDLRDLHSYEITEFFGYQRGFVMVTAELFNLSIEERNYILEYLSDLHYLDDLVSKNLGEK